MQQRTSDHREHGFTLIELLVVVIIIGILAAIAIPRLLEQRQAAWNATAISDLRNLVAVQTSLEAGTGFTEDPAAIAAQDWVASGPSITACADVVTGGGDLLLAAWHHDGSVLYTWRRTEGPVEATEGAVPDPGDCAAALPGMLGDDPPTDVS